MTEWIVTSSVLVLVVVALRYLLRGKISLRLQYGLWALVLIRLLVPFSFVQSPISVMNAVEIINTVELSADAYTYSPAIENIEFVPDVDNDPTDTVTTGSIVGYYPGDSDKQFPTVIVPNATVHEYEVIEKAIEAKDILVPIWLTGVGVMLAVFLISNLRFGGVLRRDRRWLDVPGSIVPVYISAKVETPCLFGFLRPAIYVTEDCAGDESVLRHVLAHESTHYRHGDNIWAVLRCLCLALHWYNPLVWLAAFLSRRDAELACDEGAIKRLGEDERMNYGRTLIGLTCQDVAAKGLVLTATTMTGSKKSIRERIMLIAKKPRMALYTLVAVLLVAAVAVGCTFSGAESGFTDRDAKKEAKSLAAGCANSNYLQLMDNPEILRYKGEDDRDKYIRVSYPLKNDERHIVVFLNMCDKNGNYLDEPYSAEVILSNSGLPIIGDISTFDSITMWNKRGEEIQIPTRHYSDLLEYLFQFEYGELWPPQIAEQLPAESVGFTVYYADGSSTSFGLNSISLPGDIYYQVQRPGEPDWLYEIITGGNAEADEAPESSESLTPAPATPSVTVSTEHVRRTPYLHLAHSKEWTENGWLMADGKTLTAEYIESIAAWIPTLSYTPRLSLDFSTSLWQSLSVYDQNFQPIHVNGEYGYEGLTALRWLEPGTYYCVFGVYGPQGEYVESEGEYESSSYQCIFRLMVIEDEFTAQGFENYTGWDIKSVYLSSGSNSLIQIRSRDKINEIERILSTARDMGFVGACGYGDTFYLMGDGGTIAICLAGDDCSNFFSDGKCWEISDADMEILRDIVAYPTRTGSDFYFTGDAEALVDYYAREIYAKELFSVPSGEPYAITDYKLVDCSLYALRVDGGAVVGQMKFAVSPEEPEQAYWWAGNTVMGEGEYAGMLTMYRQFTLTCMGDGYWGLTSMGTGGAGGWGYTYIQSADDALSNILHYLEQGNSYAENIMSTMPLVNWADVPADSFAGIMDIVENTCTGGGRIYGVEEWDTWSYRYPSDQHYRNLFCMKAALNMDGAYAERIGTILRKQYEHDPEVFQQCLQLFTAEQQRSLCSLVGGRLALSSLPSYYVNADYEAIFKEYLDNKLPAEYLDGLYAGLMRFTDFELIDWAVDYIGLTSHEFIGVAKYAVKPEDPELVERYIAGSTVMGEGDYEGWTIWTQEFTIKLQPDGNWVCTGRGTGGAGGWGYIAADFSPELIRSDFNSALEAHSKIGLLRVLPLIDFSDITQEQTGPFFELLRDSAVKASTSENSQFYSDLYVMKAAQNTDGAFTELFALVLQTQYEYDPDTFADAMRYLSFEQQQVISYYLDYVLEYN